MSQSPDFRKGALRANESYPWELVHHDEFEGPYRCDYQAVGRDLSPSVPHSEIEIIFYQIRCATQSAGYVFLQACCKQDFDLIQFVGLNPSRDNSSRVADPGLDTVG